MWRGRGAGPDGIASRRRRNGVRHCGDATRGRSTKVHPADAYVVESNAAATRQEPSARARQKGPTERPFVFLETAIITQVTKTIRLRRMSQATLSANGFRIPLDGLVFNGDWRNRPRVGLRTGPSFGQSTFSCDSPVNPKTWPCPLPSWPVNGYPVRIGYRPIQGLGGPASHHKWDCRKTFPPGASRQESQTLQADY